MNALAPRIDLGGKTEPVFLDTDKAGQMMHKRWWTSLPAIPSSRNSPAYRRLWRQFADHTMNTFKNDAAIVKPGNRGFYVEGREDHLVPAFFENFELFPVASWLQRLLSTLAIPLSGDIVDAAWSYSYSEFIPGQGRPHADIIVMWRDHLGEAVLVIEAKKPGVRTLGPKDDPRQGIYLNYSSMRGIGRRYQALLVDHRDLAHLSGRLDPDACVCTWQDLAEIQLWLVDELDVDGPTKGQVRERLGAQHEILGLATETSLQISTRGTAERYAEFRALEWPAPVTEWLIGTELYFASRSQGAVVEAPYGWLAEEPTVFEFAKNKGQSTAARERALWKLSNVGIAR